MNFFWDKTPFSGKGKVRTEASSKEKTKMIKSKVALSKQDQQVVDTLALISVLADSRAKAIIRNSVSTQKEGRKNGKK
jgi:hypothetical protein